MSTGSLEDFATVHPTISRASELFDCFSLSMKRNGRFAGRALPHRMNERLTIQQGLFLCANRALFPFHRCLVALLLHSNKEHKPSARWLHKLVVTPGTRLDVLRALNKLNINSATPFHGLDGFCQSLFVNVEIQGQEDWPGVSQTTDRERWVKGI
jgi:hypothetical protein